MILVAEQDLAALGEDRPTLTYLRMFLSRLAMQFYNLTSSALNGAYHETDAGFFMENDVSRNSRTLGARIHCLNASFADYMRQNGQKRKVCLVQASEDSPDAEVEPGEGQLLLTESQMKQ